MKSYLVGGAVRDALLGLPVVERDWVVVGGTDAQLRELDFKSVGKQFPVFLHPQTGEEYALARTEQKIAPGYHGFRFNTNPDITIEEDLKRRDLTINAIAQDENGKLIDPWGGQHDLDARVLRHISDAFSEDPVRVLRVARFAARFYSLGFKIAPETLALMEQMVQAGEIDQLVPERVWQEVEKSLTANTPSVFWQVLLRVGALARIAPELNDFLNAVSKQAILHNTPQPLSALAVIDQAAGESPEVLLAILACCAGQRGISLVPLGARWKLPNQHRWLIEAVVQFDGVLGRAQDLSGAELLDVLEQADALRRRERFRTLLSAYQLCRNLSAERLSQALNKVAEIDLRAEVQQLSGAAAKRRVRELRLKALKDL